MQEVMKVDVSIIKANPEHTEDISRICANGWKQTVKDFLSEEYQKETVAFWYNHKRVEADILAGAYTHVALVDGKVVGTIGGVINEAKESLIYVFYVDEKYRYKGIGGKLLDVFTENHLKLGATIQLVSVHEGNDLGIPFYESKGFQIKEQNTKYTKKGERVSTFRYWRNIPIKIKSK